MRRNNNLLNVIKTIFVLFVFVIVLNNTSAGSLYVLTRNTSRVEDFIVRIDLIHNTNGQVTSKSFKLPLFKGNMIYRFLDAKEYILRRKCKKGVYFVEITYTGERSSFVRSWISNNFNIEENNQIKIFSQIRTDRTKVKQRKNKHWLSEMYLGKYKYNDTTTIQAFFSNDLTEDSIINIKNPISRDSHSI